MQIPWEGELKNVRVGVSSEDSALSGYATHDTCSFCARVRTPVLQFDVDWNTARGLNCVALS
ncbi:MAG: hypothetical protein EAZ43_04080 [Betaproteobacteria bacterium]|nr:MAG: hypothetical protein EAZ43_04080 [Betaproteobacteria bacterium]